MLFQGPITPKENIVNAPVLASCSIHKVFSQAKQNNLRYNVKHNDKTLYKELLEQIREAYNIDIFKVWLSRVAANKCTGHASAPTAYLVTY